MKICAFVVGVVVCVVGFSLPAVAAEDGLIAWWSFDEGQGRIAVDSAGGQRDRIQKFFWYLPGVSQTGLKLDGFTTFITRDAADAPKLGDAFTIEAWVAPQAYPWNWCAIASQEAMRQKGYFFGIDEVGHVGLHVAIDGKWYECTTDATIPFMEKWSHIAGTFDPAKGITVYIDGKQAAHLDVKGKPTYATNVTFQIGRNQTLLPATPLVRPWLSIPASYSFDGILDELKIYNRALTASEIQSAYRSVAPQSPALSWRKLPQLPAGTHPFGARHTNLQFYREWDELWRVWDHPDVVVMFDELPGKMVFWRGTNYNMNLVTENGRWVGDQSSETGSNWELEVGPLTALATGCCEHMSDKQNRFTHVRVIENHDARVVVHWRYALSDVQYKIANTDPISGWGDWADEYYYIYPDGVSVRAAFIHGLEDGYSLTEPATYNQPGEKAEDNVEIGAVTAANMKGQVETYYWDPWPDISLEEANMCIVNFKSKFKPFYIYEPGAQIGPYGARSETRPEYSRFPTWNHWPVGQMPTDGRYAVAADRVSSSAILSPEAGMAREEPGGPLRARFIMGLTDQPIETLLPLAKSWLHAPALAVKTQGYDSHGYSRDQRAFILENVSGASKAVAFDIAASGDSPLVNPAFVIKNWAASAAQVKINGHSMPRGPDLRIGRYQTLESSDLIVWIKMHSTEPVKIELSPGL